MSLETATEPLPLKPRALRKGDLIGIAAPASPVDEKALRRGCRQLESLGYRIKLSSSILESEGYFAGSIGRRVAELHAIYECDDVAALVCARGGYGCNHLLPYLDLGLIKSKPKILVGYSDITTLLTYFADEGMTTFHGPMAAIDFARKDGVDLDSWQAVLGGKEFRAKFTKDDGVQVVRTGRAEGIFYGGCLSMVEASLGTPFEVETGGKILFLEDKSVHPYQIDRMLTHLRMAGKFEGVAALVLGHFDVEDEVLLFALQSALAGLDLPIVTGLPAGHVTQGNLTLPIGVNCMLKATSGGFTLNFEKAVRD